MQILFFLRRGISFSLRLFNKTIYPIKKIIAIQSSLKVKLINYSKIGEKIFVIKPSGIEKIPFSKVIDHIEGGEIHFIFPQIDLKRYSNAIIFPKSDFIVIENEVIWHKSQKTQFTKIVPAEKNLIKFKNNILYIKKPKKIIEINNGFSLCGVHSNTWAHFLVQYFPKIDYIQRLISIINEEITIIVPVYNDHQIKAIIEVFCKGIKVIELQDDEVAYCNNLFHIENLSFISDHADYLSPSDLIVPDFVISFLKDKFINNNQLFPSSILKPNNNKRKLFIQRSGYRNIKNIDELEAFFRSEGFEFIEPQYYTLDQKRIIFQEASIIVGPGSSGFTNVIFCKPGTIVLGFVNFQRIYDLYMPSLAKVFDLKLYLLTGTDINPSSPHSAFNIPIDKIIKEYRKIVKSNDLENS